MKRIFHSSILAFSAVFVLAMQPAYGEMPPAPMIWVMKTDSLGDSLWVRFYEGKLPISFGQNCVQQTTDGGLILTGSHVSNRVSSLYILKLNSNYDSAWSRAYGREDGGVYYYNKVEKANENKGKLDTFSMPLTRNLSGVSVIETPNKGYLILGQLGVDYAPYARDVFEFYHDGVQVIKTDSLGNILWKRTFLGDIMGENIYRAQTPDNGYVLIGNIGLADSSPSCLFLKLDSLGDSLWSRTYGLTELYSTHQTKDGGYAIIGRKNSMSVIIEVDSLGFIIGEHRLGRGKESEGLVTSSINLDTGYIASCLVEDSLLLVRINQLGETISEGIPWPQNIAFAMNPLSDEGYIITGLKISTFRKPWLARISDDDDILWEKEYSFGSSSTGKWVKHTIDGNFIIVGCILGL